MFLALIIIELVNFYKGKTGNFHKKKKRGKRRGVNLAPDATSALPDASDKSLER